MGIEHAAPQFCKRSIAGGAKKRGATMALARDRVNQHAYIGEVNHLQAATAGQPSAGTTRAGKGT